MKGRWNGTKNLNKKERREGGEVIEEAKILTEKERERLCERRVRGIK